MIDIENVVMYPPFISDIVHESIEQLKAFYGDLKFDEIWEYGKYIENTGEQYRLLEPMIIQCCKQLEECKLTSYHATRVISKEEILNEGIVKSDNYYYIDRIRNLCCRLNFPRDCIDELIQKCQRFFQRDSNRRGTVHFFSCKSICDTYLRFADNLGGEIVDFALNSDFSISPYDRLIEFGKPILIKFAYSFSDVAPTCKDSIALELIKVKIINILFNELYLPKFDGWVNASIPARDILTIQDFVRS